MPIAGPPPTSCLAIGSLLPLGSTSAEAPVKQNRRHGPLIDFLASPGPFNTSEPSTPLTVAMIDNVRASGITAVNLTVDGESVEEVFRNLGRWNGQIAAYPDALAAIRNWNDLARANQLGQLGLIYGFQDPVSIGTDLSRVELFHQFGVRVIQLTYNTRNLYGDGCLEPSNGGLTRLGHGLIEELNARKTIIDLSHCGQRTTTESIQRSKAPVAISHTGCRSLVNLPRNKSDDELRQLADRGGVAGMYLMPFLTVGAAPSATDLLRHIDHAVQVCGEDHVGIGSDLSISPHIVTAEYRSAHRAFVIARQKAGVAAPGEDPDVFMFIPDLNTPTRLLVIADLLHGRGYSDSRIEKIIGGNCARLLRDIWQ